MEPIIAQSDYTALYATYTFTAEATKNVNLNGRKVVGVALDSAGTIGSVTTFDLYPRGLGVASSNTTIGSLAVNKVFYASYPRLNAATIKLNSAYTGDLTLILE